MIYLKWFNVVKLQKNRVEAGEVLKNKATKRIDIPFIDCAIFSCENVYDTSGSVSKLKASELFDICFVVSGGGIHKVLDREIPCAEGDICIISPSVAHGFFITDKDDILTVRRIRFALSDWFSGDTVDKTSEGYCYGAFEGNPIISYATLNSYMRKRIYALFDYIECEALERGKDWQVLVRGYLSNLLISIGRYVNSAIKNFSFVSSRSFATVEAAIAIIKNECSDSTLTLEAIAERLYLSKSQLSRAFGKVTGVAFSEYLHGVRLKRVCTLLQDADKTVEVAAKECGFHSMAAFYKLFFENYGVTPGEYRASVNTEDNTSDEYKLLLKGEKIMAILSDISENLQKGKAKIVKELVQAALDEGVRPADILEQGLLAGMSVVGEKFKNNEIYVPEVLVAARAMNMGAQILKPHLIAEGITAQGKVCIGTVQGDLHDIGKNLVKMMMEGKGLEVIDLGTDVAPEAFVKTAIDEGCGVICCSALLTTTMNAMADVVKTAEAMGVRDKVKIMIGGAPVTETFREQIGADAYTPDAASAADVAVSFFK